MKMLHWLAWLVGVLVIGALGNALWELVFRDFFGWSSRSLLTLFTLGLDSMRNSIYTHVAQGHHEEPSVILLLIVLCSSEGIALGFLVLPVGKRILFENLTGEERQREPRLRRSSFYAIVFFAYFFLGSALSGILTMTYTNLAITHFEHSLTICAPYLTKHGQGLLAHRQFW